LGRSDELCDRVRRVPGRAGADPGIPDGSGSALRRHDELQLHARRLGQPQPGDVPGCAAAGAGLAERGLHRPGPLAAAGAGDALAARLALPPRGRPPTAASDAGAAEAAAGTAATPAAVAGAAPTAAGVTGG